MSLRMTEFLREHLARVEPFADADGWKLQQLVEETADRNCIGVPVDVFFPTVEENGAKPDRQVERDRIEGVCRGCPVADECLAGGVLRGERYGGWGGVAQPDFQELGRFWRQKHGSPVGADSVDRTQCGAARHGTNSAYSDGCRCSDARAARRQYMRQQAASKGVA